MFTVENHYDGTVRFFIGSIDITGHIPSHCWEITQICGEMDGKLTLNKLPCKFTFVSEPEKEISLTVDDEDMPDVVIVNGERYER